MHSTLINPHWCNLNKTTFFQSKLNELAQKVSLVSKFCLTVQIQYFEVSLFVAFECEFLCQMEQQCFCFGSDFPALDLCWRSLQRTKLFQRKLNNLPQDFSLASKFFLKFQIQYFEVLFFIVFKCQVF